MRSPQLPRQIKRPRLLPIAGLVALTLAATGLMTVAPATAAPALITNPIQYVNVFGGTGNGGGEVGDINDFPGPAMPFGMVQFSPDTHSQAGATSGAATSGKNGAGYHYPDTSTRGFSMTHASQGCSLYGDIPVIPSTWSNLTGTGNTNGPWAQRLGYTKNPSSEVGEVGYYKLTGVDQAGSTIVSELGATTRAATATFTYPAGTTPQVFLKPSQHNNSSNYGSAMRVDPVSGTVYAEATSGNFCTKGNRYTVYYALKFDAAWTGFGTWNNGAAQADRTTVTNTAGQELGGYFTFAPAASGETQIRVRMAISYVSNANAELNLTTEIPTLDANTLGNVKAAAQATWNAALGKITVSQALATGQTPGLDPDRDLKAFYTAFYHSITHPSTFSDVNGQYIGFESTPVVHNVGEKPAAGGRQRVQYSSFSDWDTYRCQAALVAAFWPDRGSDQAQSLVNAAQQMGSYPQWTVANATTNQMTGDNVPPLLSSTYAMGAADWDLQTALDYMVSGAIGPNAGKWTGGTNTSMGNTLPMVERPGAPLYNELGYAPQSRYFQADHAISGASYTEEYALDDFSISEFAAALGRNDIAATFYERSHWWQNLYNPTTNFIQPRDLNGKFPEGSAMVQYLPDTNNQNLLSFGWTHPNKNPDGFGQVGFDEGNAEQYLWFVPHNIAALVDALGGKSATSARLDSFFTELKVGPQVDARGGPYMFAGNEPNFGAPWIYNYIGEPWKSQEVVDRMSQQIFGYGPTDAAPGNDDLGAMSSWLVWAGIGAYPVTVGTDVMAVNTPMFEQIVVQLGNGKTITVNAPGAQADRDSRNGEYRYIGSMKINGTPQSATWFDLSELSANAVIDYEVRSVHNDWGTAATDSPPSWRAGGNALAANINPSNNAYFGVMGSAPGATAAGRLDVQRIESTEAAYTVTSAANHPGIVLRDPGELAFDSRGHGRVNLVWDIAPFTPSDVYEVTVTVAAGAGSTTATGHIRVNAPGSLESFRNMVGTTYYAAARGRFDTATSGTSTNLYLRDELDQLGFTPLSVHDVTDSDGVTTTFTWPGAPHQYPETVNPAAYLTVELDRPASRLSVIGAAVTPNTFSKATLWITDGTHDKSVQYDISLGDWQNPSPVGDPATGGLDPVFGNTKIAWTPTRATTSANNAGPFTVAPGPYIFATKAYVAPTGWKVTRVGIPSPGRSPSITNLRIFALAQESATLAISTPVADAGGSVGITGSGFAAGEPVTVTADTVPAANAVIEADWKGDLSGALHIPRAAGLGAYTVTAQAASAPEAPQSTVTVDGVYVYDPVISAPTSVAAGADLAFSGSGFEPGETVTATLGANSAATTANSAGTVSGTVAAPATGGSHVLSVVGALSATARTVTVQVQDPPAPTPQPTVTVTVPGPTATVPGPTVTVPVDVPGPTVTVTEPAVEPPADKVVPAASLAAVAQSVFGASVTLTATVSTGSGSVEFLDGSAVLGSAALSGTVATLKLSGLAVGSHAVTARYPGDDATQAVSTSAKLVTVAKAKSPKVAVAAKAFKAKSKPKVTVSVAKLNNGRVAVGKVKVFVGAKAVKTVKLTAAKKGKVTVKLPKRYSKAIKVKAQFLPDNPANVASTTSKVKKVKTK